MHGYVHSNNGLAVSFEWRYMYVLARRGLVVAARNGADYSPEEREKKCPGALISNSLRYSPNLLRSESIERIESTIWMSSESYKPEL